MKQAVFAPLKVGSADGCGNDSTVGVRATAVGGTIACPPGISRTGPDRHDRQPPLCPLLKKEGKVVVIIIFSCYLISDYIREL